jgi:putative transcriptional regulator
VSIELGSDFKINDRNGSWLSIMVKLEIQIKELTKKHDISLRELSRRSDVRHPAIIDLANGKRQRPDFSHFERIVEALDIEDMNELIAIVRQKDE